MCNNCIVERGSGSLEWLYGHVLYVSIRWSRGGLEWTSLVLASSTSIPSLFLFVKVPLSGVLVLSGILCHTVTVALAIWVHPLPVLPGQLVTKVPQCHPPLQSCPEGNVKAGGVLSLFPSAPLRLFWSQWAKSQCRIQIKLLL